MGKTIWSAFAAAAAALLTACAQPPPPTRPLPPGPTPEEVADYARAVAQYRSALASGNGDVVMQATHTFSLIAQEILSRRDPRLFDAEVVCRRYPVAGPTNQPVELWLRSRNSGQANFGCNWSFTESANRSGFDR